MIQRNFYMNNIRQKFQITNLFNKFTNLITPQNRSIFQTFLNTKFSLFIIISPLLQSNSNIISFNHITYKIKSTSTNTKYEHSSNTFKHEIF